MVRCGACGGENRDEARFCSSCGGGLAVTCPACGAAASRPEARFCDSCGAELSGPVVAGDQARKVVTILFADLVGSTSAQEGADPEAVRRWVDRYYEVLRREIEGHGGRVAKFTGDGVMAVYGIPEVREDDARRAIETAEALHAAVPLLGGGAGAPERLALRIGINTGEVVVSSVDDDVVGDVVNVAARLQTAAGAGQVLVGESTFRLVRLGAQLRALPPLDLKGKSAPVNAFLLSSLTRGDEGPASPFVGRAGELERLSAVLDDAIGARRARLASIVGSPGVGKTRLARELAGRAGDRARVVDVRCEAVGGSTFAPIAAALRQAAGLDDDATEETVLAALTALFDEDEADRHRVARGVAGILGVGEPGLPEETFWAVRRLIENAGQRSPIVFVFDDVHWAEPLLLDLIENVAEWTRGAPVMLLLTARPELRELRPSLVEVGGRVQVAINLEGLEVDESRRLTRELVGGVELPDALLDRVASASEGNPLFVGELMRMLVDDGVLDLSGGTGRVTVDLAELEVPVTIHALLGARIDRLAPGERAVLEAASVVGKTFYRGVLTALVPAELVPQLDEHLEGLRRKELVEPAGTYWLDEPVLRFHHVLIRDAAYRRLLKETRAALHEQAARWLEEKVGDLAEHDDVIGYQLEQAHLLRVEAGEAQVGLGREAADRLAAAGRRSLEADDRPAAAALLGRALACLPADSDDRGELLVERCEALLAMGDATEAAGAVLELVEVAGGSPRLEAWAACFAGELANLRDAGALAETAARAEQAATRLAELDDAAGEAKAHAVRAASLARLGRIAECEASLDRALAAARRAGDRRRATAILAGAPVAALWGPNPVTRASGRCLDVVRVLRITSRAPAVEATSLRCQAVLEALRGRDDAARRMLGSARRALEELGHEHGLLEVDLAAGMAELLAERPGDAERLLRQAHEGFHALGADVDAGLAAALLARVRLGAGDVDEALELTVESEKLGGDDLKASIVWRAVRAEALAQRGELEAARKLAEQAVALAAPTDALLDHADALLALAEVLRASGDSAVATDRARLALDLYERKEASVPADRVRAFLGGEPAGADARVPETTATDHPTVAAFHAFFTAALAGRWDEVEEMLAEDAVTDDRRPIVGLGRFVGRAAWILAVRSVIDIGIRGMHLTVVAARGERLGLVRGRVGDLVSNVELLNVFELDERGRFVANIGFAHDQLVEATAELDRRFMATLDPARAAEWEHTAPLFVAMLERDKAGMEAVLTDDFVGQDHRPMGWGTVDRSEYCDLYVTSSAWAPGVWFGAADVLEVTPWGSCLHGAARGTTADGSDFETSGLLVFRSRDGRLCRTDYFPLDARAEALAALHGAAAPASADAALANLATRPIRVFAELAPTGRTEGIAPHVASDIRHIDRRPIMGGLEEVQGLAAFVDFLGSTLQIGVRAVDVDVLAIRGERLCLASTTWRNQADEPGSTRGLTVLQVDEVDRDGRLIEQVVFDPDQLVDAVAELDRRFATQLDPPRREVLEGTLRLFEALNRHDWDRMSELMPAAFRAVDRRLVGWGEVDRDGYIDLYRNVVAMSPDVVWFSREVAEVTPHGVCASVTKYGSTTEGAVFETEAAVVTHAIDGVVERLDVFPITELPQALDLLHERGRGAASPTSSAPLRNLASEVARLGFDLCLELRWDEVRALLDDAVELTDHRPIVGGGSKVVGPGAVLENLRSVPAIGVRDIDVTVVATRGAGLALLQTSYGTKLTGRGGLETLQLIEVTDRGLVSRNDIYELEQLADAARELDRLHLLRLDPELAAVLEVADPVHARCMAQDWDGVERMLAPRFRGIDHRPLGWGEVDRAGLVEVYRTSVAQAPGVVFFTKTFHGFTRDGVCAASVKRGRSSDGALFETESITVAEVRDGLIVQIDYYPPDEAARAMGHLRGLDRDHPAQENAATRFWDRWLPRLMAADWAGVAELMADDVVGLDSRPLLGETDTLVGREAVIEGNKGVLGVGVSSLELTPLELGGDHWALAQARYSGRAGSTEVLQLFGVAADGGLRFSEVFELSQRDQALARLHELSAERDAPAAASPNAAVRFVRDGFALARAGRWDELDLRYRIDARWVDHRPLVGGVELQGREEVIGATRMAVEVGAESLDVEVIATRGERCALVRSQYSGAQGSVEMLELAVLDGEGRLEAADIFDPTQLDEALAHLDERFLAGEGAARAREWRTLLDLMHAVNDADVDRMREILGPGYEAVDHRPLGFGHLDAEGHLALFQTMWDESSDARYSLPRTRGSVARGVLSEVDWTGTRDGGAFSRSFRLVLEVDGDQARRLDVFELADVEAAEARLAEIASASEQTALGNAASRYYQWSSDRLVEGDWEALVPAAGEDSEIVDRRSVVGGFDLHGREATLAFSRSVADAGVRAMHSQVLAIRGDRLALLRTELSGRDGTVEIVQVVEIDADGRSRAFVLFDSDAFDEAHAELDARWLEIMDPRHRATCEASLAFQEALNSHDVRAVEAQMHPEMRLHDHRQVGFGEVDRAGYLGVFEALVETSPDVRWRVVRDLHTGPASICAHLSLSGSNETGGPFVIDWIVVGTVCDGRVGTLDLYALEDAAAAEALFAELTDDRPG